MAALRQSFRSLVRRPAFSLTAVLTLACGIGATTAVFSVVDAVLIRELPYPHADRLVTVSEASPASQQRGSLIAPARLEDWNRRNQTFVALSGSYAESVTDTSRPEPERLDGRRVQPRFFEVFGVDPLIGRTFTPEEERFGGPGAAVISDGLWARRYARQPSALHQPLVIGGRPFSIVGVMPAAFAAPSVDVWLPAALPPQLMQVREARFVGGVGRLKPGISVEQATADLDRVQRALGEEFPSSDRGWSAAVADLKNTRVADYRRPLVLVFAAVGLLFTIAVANIAGLMLVQLRRRAREFAVRMAIGASRARIVGTAMRESGLVAVAGAAIGVLAAAGLVTLFKVTFSTLPRLDEVRLDWRAVAFSTAAIAIATLVCGLLPVWHITRGRLQSTVASGGRSVSSGRHGLQQLLVVGQIALSLLLVGAAGMLLRSYYNLSHVAMGFDADDVVTFRVGAAWNEDRPRIGRLQERLVAELRERPGIEAAGITSFLPATGATLRSQITVEGVVGPEANGAMTVGYRTISAGYLQALRVPLLQGQWCPDLRMDFNVPRQVLVNRQFVDTFGDGQRLIGRELRVAQSNWSGASIAGVVGNVVEDGQSAGHAPYVYACDSAGSWPDPVYVVRTRDASALMGGIREIVNRLDSTRAVFSVRSLPDVMRQSLNQPRLDAQLLTTFAVAALALAALGLYSLFMLLVAERARELGVRMALGAAPGDLLRLVFGGAGRLIAAGVLAGLILTLAASRVLQVVLFGVSALDVPTLASALAVLVIVAFVAVTLPALRAARIDPIEAIRTE